MRLTYALYGFGILFSLVGVGVLAAEYVKYLSEVWKLVALLLTVGIFAFLTNYFKGKGW